MALKGPVTKLRSLPKALQALPIKVATSVASVGATRMTKLTQEAFAGGQTVYSTPRPLSVTGRPLDLEESGATKQALTFRSTGTTVRASLPTRWAKYLIGKYGILPNGSLPISWAQALRDITAEELRREAAAL